MCFRINFSVLVLKLGKICTVLMPLFSFFPGQRSRVQFTEITDSNVNTFIMYLRRYTALFVTEKIYYLFEPILQPEAANIALIITSF